MKKQISNDSTVTKTIVAPHFSMAELLGREEKPEKGFFTAVQWANKLQVPTRTVQGKLSVLVLQKKVIKKFFRVRRGDGVRATPHFKEA
jgi:hypothetical protein